MDLDHVPKGNPGGEWFDDAGLEYLPASKAFLRLPDEASALRRLPYPEYLRTGHWEIMRRRALLRAGGHCQRCWGERRRLDVHHLTYERLGRERESDLVVLCATCHAAAHNLSNGGP